MTLKNSYFGPDEAVLGGTDETGPTLAAGGTIFDWLIDRLDALYVTSALVYLYTRWR